MSLELSPEEQKLQDNIDKLTDELYSQLGISSSLLKEESATEMAIKAYDTYTQSEFKGGKANG